MSLVLFPALGTKPIGDCTYVPSNGMSGKGPSKRLFDFLYNLIPQLSSVADSKR